MERQRVSVLLILVVLFIALMSGGALAADAVNDYGLLIFNSPKGAPVRVISELGGVVTEYDNIVTVTLRDGVFLLGRRDGPPAMYPRENFAIELPKTNQEVEK